MKLNEPKVEIISRGTDPSVDFTFSDNFCPCCGKNCQKVQIKKFTGQGLLFTYYGRKVIIKCPSCGTTFQKEIYDSKELTSISDTLFIFLVIILMLSILSLVLFAVFHITTGVIVSLIILIISFVICGWAASS